MAIVLVVDDEQSILNIVVEVIEEMGHQVVTALNGRDALLALGHACADLVLTDIMMPYVDGLELCRRLKSEEATAHVSVVLMSAGTGSGADTVPMDGFLRKPFALDELERVVRHALDARVIASGR